VTKVPARARLAKIRLLVCDVDGVLTDGGLTYGAPDEIKTFHVRDGLGLRQLLDNGVEVALITGRRSAAVQQRAFELGITRVVDGCADKREALGAMIAELRLTGEEVCYVGDDANDLPALALAGIAAAVADAHHSVRDTVEWVTRARGGLGAVREVADAILAARSAAYEGTFKVVIPARYAATRLPGKPLAPIAGRPMIAHVWDRAVESGAAEIWVACDDERIRAAVEGFGGRAMMTSPEHASGTDRIAEVAERQGWPDDTMVVNLQGDEPGTTGEAIRACAAALAAHRTAGIATIATPIREPAELFDPDVVKVVLDDHDFARWFSRAPIPWVRGVFDAGPPPALPDGVPFLRHLGLYAYRVGVLRSLCAAPPAAHESVERLEQLRALTRGVAIVVAVLDNAGSRGVDSPTDLARIQHELSGRATR
jgi:3-deoxy-manno-octulosonate cytidylyltransferase (CMP-KDO synthetase)